jgi:hypothetical protein
MPHSIIHSDACLAKFNKERDIPAAAYYHPYGYYPPRCGYYPYPPCY